jgi:hypothetical protein
MYTPSQTAHKTVTADRSEWSGYVDSMPTTAVIPVAVRPCADRLCGLACAQRGDELGDLPDEPGPGDRVAVVRGVHDLAIPDREDHEEAHGKRLTRLGELAVELVFDDHDLGVGGLVDDDIAQALIPPLCPAGSIPALR